MESARSMSSVVKELRMKMENDLSVNPVNSVVSFQLCPRTRIQA